MGRLVEGEVGLVRAVDDEVAHPALADLGELAFPGGDEGAENGFTGGA